MSEPEHYEVEKVYVENASYTGPAFPCACGERWVDRNGLLDHLKEKSAPRCENEQEA